MIAAARAPGPAADPTTGRGADGENSRTRWLLNLLPMSSAIVQRYREQILSLAARHGAGNVRVFGSLARGEGAESSDLDLLVTLGKGRSLLDLVGLKQDLEDLVRRPVDVVTEQALSPYLREQVLSEAIPL
jgi:uncharacterized protein